MEKLKEILKTFLMGFGIVFFVTGSTFFLIRIDECKLAETRYCPSCGIDLVNN